MGLPERLFAENTTTTSGEDNVAAFEEGGYWQFEGSRQIVREAVRRWNAHGLLVAVLEELKEENELFDPACDSVEDFIQRTWDIIIHALTSSEKGGAA